MAVVAGCTPAGPRALLKGRQLLDQGDYEAAVVQLKNATSLLATNAQAWNYYGVALQQAGHPDEAVAAYQSALRCDRDLMEAHFNLGSLAADQGKSDLARAELTAYTLRRSNDPAGWLKLGAVQLKLGETAPAERSFSTAYHLDTNNPAALNSLGLACIKRNSPRDAVRFFNGALQLRADYAPAILNLATVNQQYLHDSRAALENFKKYLALAPRPANWEEVNALVASLEAAEAKAFAAATPVEKPAPVVPASEVKTPPKATAVVTQHLASAAKPPAAGKTANPTPAAKPAAKPAVKPLPMEVVELKPESAIISTPKAGAPMTTAPETLTAPMPAEPPKKSLFGKWFGGSANSGSQAENKYSGPGLTPLPGNEVSTTEPAVIPAAKPMEVAPPVPVFARYSYYAPRKPAAGDRTAANGAFTKARLCEQEEKWPDALNWYRQAAALDPAWFEAQYNTAVVAHRLQNYALALTRYELSLSIQPESADARYNFALVLKAAGYAPDAAEQLKKVLAANPGDVRAHLALANICAQSLRETATARQHYLKVLELDPGNSQAMDIRFWLSANPK